MKITSNKHQDEMYKLLREDIHPANLMCPRCRCDDTDVYLDIDGSGCRKKVECKKCQYIWVVAEYGKN